MNITLLHAVCKKATKAGYADFKHYIDNALFPLTKNIIDLEIVAMKASIGQSIAKKVGVAEIANTNQWKERERIVNSYIDVAIQYALRYGEKSLLK